MIHNTIEKEGNLYSYTPRFINGYLNTSTGAREYDTSATWLSTCITEDILHVKAGSWFAKKSASTVGTISIFYYSEDGDLVTTESVNSTLKYFSEDAYIRIRIYNSAWFSASSIYEDYHFNLILDKPKTDNINISFLGFQGENGVADRKRDMGDCTLFCFPNNKNMLVDFHQEKNKLDLFLALRRRGVRKLDYIMISHYHGDHMGSLAYLVKERYIDIDGCVAFLPPEITEESVSQTTVTGDAPSLLVQRQSEIVALLTEHNCTIVRPTERQEYKIGDAILKFYNTDHSVFSVVGGEFYSTNYNDWSLCFELIYGHKVVNMTGDIGWTAQAKVGGTLHKCDILKSAHHGWDNGVNNCVPAFINTVCPEIVISINGTAHLPSEASTSLLQAGSPIQSWCEANGVPHYCTALNGNIDVSVGKESLRVLTPVTKYIRNDKNWKYNDNTEFIEE